MPKHQTKSVFLTVRLTPQERKQFGVKADSYGGPTYVIREIVKAFIDDRLTIKPDPDKRSLYHVARKQD